RARARGRHVRDGFPAAAEPQGRGRRGREPGPRHGQARDRDRRRRHGQRLHRHLDPPGRGLRGELRAHAAAARAGGQAAHVAVLAAQAAHVLLARGRRRARFRRGHEVVQGQGRQGAKPHGLPRRVGEGREGRDEDARGRGQRVHAAGRARAPRDGLRPSGARGHDRRARRGEGRARQRARRHRRGRLLCHQRPEGIRRRRHAPRPVAGGLGDSRGAPVRARGRRFPDGKLRPSPLTGRPITALTLFALVAVVGYAAAMLLTWAFQEKLLFYPRAVAAPPAAPPGWKLEEVRLRMSDGITLAGVLVAPPAAKPPLVVYFGGNAEEVTAFASTAADTYGARAVLLVNYRGYGDSAGSPSEKALVSDGIAIVDWAARRADIDASRIAIHGRSLGTGVAVQVASARPPRCVLLTSPF